MEENLEDDKKQNTNEQQSSKVDDDSLDSSDDKDEQTNFYIAGIGASAGGLKAFEEFFENMPSKSGIGFVLVPHLSPEHESLMSELLDRKTDMEVVEVEDGMRVKPDQVYVIPPGKKMAIVDGTLQLFEKEGFDKKKLAIDFFLRSLADDQKEKAIGIILSGTGSNGSLGLKEIKAHGGLVIAQKPQTAKYTDMPQSAIDTGFVDYILSPKEMPERLMEYVDHAEKIKVKEETEEVENALKKVFLLLRSETGHDFSGYKPSTIKRRIERRMVLHQLSSLEDYINYLQKSPREADLLFKELMIGVTRFFRDKEAFGVLKEEVLPYLFENRTDDNTFRCWVTGCSTGEEAYSIAIILKEYMEENNRDFKVQIFATDIDEDAIQNARMGEYPENIAVDVSKERLKRFFDQEENRYQIKPHIREMIVFAVQNVLQEPPFSNLDLISCRNLLIYFSSKVQKKLLPIFHYALKPDGVLFLGTSESIGEYTDLFSPLNSKWKFFTRRNKAENSQYRLIDFPTGSIGNVPSQRENRITSQGQKDVNISKMTERILLNDYAPPSVLINQRYEILYFHGRTGKYLEPAAGKPSLNLLEMARQGLKSRLRPILQEAFSKEKQVVRKNIKIKTNGGKQAINLKAKPVKAPESMEGLMLVVFEDIEESSHNPDNPDSEQKNTSQKEELKETIADLEEELDYTRENLQATIEELETSNEELQSSNEELQSMNEELHSTNEELETSKEEMQSLNEELRTVNAEYQSKIDELTEANNDMRNLLETAEIATIFVDNELSIRRFTEKVTEIINLRDSDIGRPLSDLAFKFNGLDIVEGVKAVLSNLQKKQEEIETEDGRCYRLRIKPYRTKNNVIDGAVITFVDINELKQKEKQLRDTMRYAENIVNTVRESILVLDSELKVVSANGSFYSTFQVAEEDTEGEFIYELGNGQCDIPKLRELLEDILPDNHVFEDFEVEHEFPEIGKRKMLLNARTMERETKEEDLILLAIEDVTG